jgi:hypothetical protein
MRVAVQGMVADLHLGLLDATLLVPRVRRCVLALCAARLVAGMCTISLLRGMNIYCHNSLFW